MSKIKVPTFDSMMNPLLQAMKLLGGSGTIDEIYSKTSELMNLTDEQLDVLHNPEKGSRTKVEYRLAWTRTYLKKFGLLENSSRGVWVLTPKGVQTEKVDPKFVKKSVRTLSKEKASKQIDDDNIENDDEATWRDILMSALLAMKPDAFERLAQRILRESGFIQVEVTGKSGDGGIDGRGIMRLGGLLGFRVFFQCKRYQGSVGSGAVRDFRGAMIGRADKGLIITTGNFTKNAAKEATRDGAPAIDLIDGDLLLDLLKKLEIGVDTELVTIEKVTVDSDWFSQI